MVHKWHLDWSINSFKKYLLNVGHHDCHWGFGGNSIDTIPILGTYGFYGRGEEEREWTCNQIFA